MTCDIGSIEGEARAGLALQEVAAYLQAIDLSFMNGHEQFARVPK
jgi:hypothetical protein